MGWAASSALLGEASWTTSVVDLAVKIENGTVTSNDILDVATRTETVLADLGTLAQVVTTAGEVVVVSTAALELAGALSVAYLAYRAYQFVDGPDFHPFLDDVARRFLNIVLPDGMRPIDRGTNISFLLARNFIRRDPLAIDLDGDGIETVGVDAGVLFDHDADAIKTGTGWLNADDAFVVIDRDGNGTIDSGRELFGVDTVVGTEPLTGRAIYAVDAFDALKSIDSNGDNLFNSADVQYGNLRLWRDLNQDGISQTTELQGLAEAAITSINLTTQKATKTLPGGNTQILTAAVAGLGNEAAVALNLADNPFYRQFPDHLDTTAVMNLPDMAGTVMIPTDPVSLELMRKINVLECFNGLAFVIRDFTLGTLTNGSGMVVASGLATTASSGGGGGASTVMIPSDPVSLELMRKINVLECSAAGRDRNHHQELCHQHA